MNQKYSSVFSPNRAEELGFDVWSSFVTPPFYSKLAIGVHKKPKVIIGGRGCGKTMLLRYLSHESTFSKSRKGIDKTSLSHIGLYWRADTQFANSMQNRELDEDTWNGAFKHLIAVVVGIELLRSLQSIGASSIIQPSGPSILGFDTNRLSAFPLGEARDGESLLTVLEDKLIEFEIWVNDVRTQKQPTFLPGSVFLKRLVACVRSQVPSLCEAEFFVYIDEYENLAVYQQRIVNTLLKHSEPPLVFNLAMKRNSFKTRATEGDESLSKTQDYREFDLEDFDQDNDFAEFASKILTLRLELAGNEEPAKTYDPEANEKIFSANTKTEPIESSLSQSKKIFPSMTQRDLAEEVFKDPAIRKRLLEKITKALSMRDHGSLVAPSFLRDSHPEASVIIPALLHRKLDAQVIHDELLKLEHGQENKFTGTTNWIHNNFVGCYLQLYDGLVRPCPFYSGFPTFCSMARGNLRHFLELCFSAFARNDRTTSRGMTIRAAVQAESARSVSADQLGEIRSFGVLGNNLHTFVLRLGSLLSLSQQRLTQSEPERTHFSIQGGVGELTQQEQRLLSEAIKWSVLFEEKETKKKSSTDPEGIEYVLNPIYAPYFHISYRKRRRLELSRSDASTLFAGNYEEIKRLLRDYQRKWEIDGSLDTLPLFSHLDEGAM